MRKLRTLAAGAALGTLGLSGLAAAQTASPATQAGSAQTGATQPGATQPGSTQAGAGQAAAGGVSQGATVYDPQGGTVGTVESIDGDFVVLATAKSKVRLPKSSFGAGAKGPVIAMTAAQLDQAAAQAAPAATGTGSGTAAAAKANVATGAQVTDTQGGAVGTIAEVDAQYATVTLTTGGKVRLPISAFGAGTGSTLRVAMTAAQLSAAASAAGGSSSGG